MKNYRVTVNDITLDVQCDIEDMAMAEYYEGYVIGENGYYFTIMVIAGKIAARSPTDIDVKIHEAVIDGFFKN